MDAATFWLPALFFLIAAFYASVGFGGGSSYLAVLAIAGLPYRAIPQTALICNLIVSSGGVWHFFRGGHMRFHRVLPFVVLSVPMAYLGGRIPVGRTVFLVLLGASLFVAAVRMFLPQPRLGVLARMSDRTPWLVGIPVGGALGLLSGLVGIGGGIFLAPILILTGWSDARGTAAAAAVFILVNSLSGLVGQFSKGIFLDSSIFPLVIAVLLGGQIGSRLGAYRLPVAGVKRLLAGLILFVSVRILWSAL